MSLLAYQFHECVLIIVFFVLLLAHLWLGAPRHAHTRVVVHTGHLLSAESSMLVMMDLVYCVQSLRFGSLTHSLTLRFADANQNKQVGGAEFHASVLT